MIAITMACRLLKNPRRLITAEESVSPKVSVVIPVYNSAKYLRECIDSVLAQSFSDWEVVAVDDGSPDESPSILDEYAAKDSRIKVIHKANGGVSAARNDGLDAACGKYVLFVDSDDYLDKNALQVSYEETLRTGADVVITDHWIWKDDRLETEHRFFAKEFVFTDKKDISSVQRMVLYKGYSPYPSASCSYMFSALWSKLIRREMLMKGMLRFSSSMKLYEDGLFALQVFHEAKVVAYKQVLTYHYRILPNSLCHINEDRLVEDCGKIAFYVKEFMSASGDVEILQDAYYARILFLLKKMALRGFFFKGSEKSFWTRYRAYGKLLKSSPYVDSIAAVPKLRLVGNEKKFCWLLKFRLNFLIALMYEVRARILR